MSDKEYRNTLIEEADLSTRTTIALRNGGFYRMGEVEQASTVDLLRMPNFGRKSLNEIEAWFGEHGALAGERRREALRQLDAMIERAVVLRRQAAAVDRNIEHLRARLDG